MTAVWLILSPFIFRVQDNTSLVWADCGVAAIIILLAGLSYWHPTRHAHVFILFVALGLVVWGRFSASPAPAFHQNHIAIGLFLMMIAIIPNDASRPPKDWRIPIDPAEAR
jgi:hypothetical protein